MRRLALFCNLCNVEYYPDRHDQDIIGLRVVDDVMLDRASCREASTHLCIQCLKILIRLSESKGFWQVPPDAAGKCQKLAATCEEIARFMDEFKEYVGTKEQLVRWIQLRNRLSEVSKESVIQREDS